MAGEKMVNYLSKGLIWLGIGLIILYFFYLLFPNLMSSGEYSNSGILYYCLSTAGCAFVPWGMVMGKLENETIPRKSIVTACVIGFILLGGMRVGTALFPHAPFDSIRFVPIIEAIIFLAIAAKLKTL